MGISTYLGRGPCALFLFMDTNELHEKSQEWQRIAQNVQQAAEQRAEDLGRQASDWATQAKGAAREAATTTDYYVHQYAWSAVTAATLLAVAIGFLLGRRR